jgi:hypothetical protein
VVECPTRYCWCDVIVQNIHGPTEDKSSDMMDSFHVDLECVFDKFRKYHTQILLGDFIVKVDGEEIFKPEIGAASLHKISNDNGVSSKLFHIKKSDSLHYNDPTSQRQSGTNGGLNVGKLLSGCTAGSFSRRVHPHRVDNAIQCPCTYVKLVRNMRLIIIEKILAYDDVLVVVFTLVIFCVALQCQ